MNIPNIPVEEVNQLLDNISDKVPKMINSLMGTLYSAEAGKNMGQAVGNFYKELIESGIPKEDAMQMAKDYMLNIKEVFKNSIL